MFFKKKEQSPLVSAVVVAAGSAERMQGIDKQQALLDGLPVVVRSVEALSRCPLVSEVVLVCPPQRIAEYYALVREFSLDLVSTVVGGGATRQQSVFRGIEACDPKAAYYLIHDGARPLVAAPVVEQCIRAAMELGAAAAGAPPKDTIKMLDEDGFAVSTPPREKLVAIQTPQVFEAHLYRAAMTRAQREQQDYTDDCQLVEQMGHKVKVILGDYSNLKITIPEDLAMAEAVLQFQEEGWDRWEVFE
ncbi:MAG: 2-C-methyl-D-erythritol 4-phosphate cytidylyltransferase [Oscillospiraceae bacterium]|jgi:2-C-methyl-D-erythritol 4-phosphate cytidylyltransferase